MRVAIDARKLHDFGIGTYTRNLLRHLARLDHDTEYVLLCQEPDMGIAGQLGPNFRTVLEPSPNYSIREQFHVPWVLRRERPDVFHAPHYVLPPAIRCHSVVTIHDCIHLMFPQSLPNRAAYVYAKASMWMAARRSDRILTVSEASKRDIIHFFNVHLRPDKWPLDAVMFTGRATLHYMEEEHPLLAERLEARVRAEPPSPSAVADLPAPPPPGWMNRVGAATGLMLLATGLALVGLILWGSLC